MMDAVATTKAVAGLRKVVEVLTDATAPNGDIDALVHFVIGGDEDAPVRHYSASIDEALSLVPDGVSFHVVRSADGTCGAMVGDRHVGVGKAPAMALCAAALMYRLHNARGPEEATVFAV